MIRVFGGWPTWQPADEGLRKRLPAEDVAFLGEVYGVADRWHADQKRPAGEPYTTHLLEALEILADYVGVTERDTLAAALLHDVVEDTGCTLDEVRDRFGERVAGLVDWVTKPESGGDGERHRYLSGFAAAPKEVVAVKLADRYSNVQRLHTHPRPAKRHSYYAETVAYFCPLAESNPPFDALFRAWREHYAYLATGASRTE